MIIAPILNMRVRNYDIISVNLPPDHVAQLQKLVDGGRFLTRSEAIRTAVRDFLKAEENLGALQGAE